MPPRIELEVFSGLQVNINLDGKRVGFIDAFEDREVERGVWVEYVYILERYRNSGIGTKAMKMVIEKWRSLGYETITLDDIHWESSQDFWGKLGFKGDGKRKTLMIRELRGASNFSRAH